MRLQGKKALITGASRGIGFAIAQAFVREGAEVVITGRDIETLKSACMALGEHAHPLCWDAGDADIVSEKIAQIVGILNGLDIVVNNAGILAKNDYHKKFFDLSVEEWDLTMDVNLRGTFFISREAARWMIDHGVRGHILNICSEMAYQPTFTSYGVSKWGVRALTEGLGLLLGPMGIIVNGIAPGPTTTEMMNWKPEMGLDRPKHPNGRWGLPSEMGELAVFLTCGSGDNIVGQCILSDGGHVLIGRGQGAI